MIDYGNPACGNLHYSISSEKSKNILYTKVETLQSGKTSENF